MARLHYRGAQFKVRIPRGSYIPRHPAILPIHLHGQRGVIIHTPLGFVISSKLQIPNSYSTPRESLPLFEDITRFHQTTGNTHFFMLRIACPFMLHFACSCMLRFGCSCMLRFACSYIPYMLRFACSFMLRFASSFLETRDQVGQEHVWNQVHRGVRHHVVSVCANASRTTNRWIVPIAAPNQPRPARPSQPSTSVALDYLPVSPTFRQATGVP